MCIAVAPKGKPFENENIREVPTVRPISKYAIKFSVFVKIFSTYFPWDILTGAAGTIVSLLLSGTLSMSGLKGGSTVLGGISYHLFEIACLLQVSSIRNADKRIVWIYL